MHMPTTSGGRGGEGGGRKNVLKRRINGGERGGDGSGEGCRDARGLGSVHTELAGAGAGQVILFLIIVAGCVGAEVSTSLGELC